MLAGNYLRECRIYIFIVSQRGPALPFSSTAAIPSENKMSTMGRRAVIALGVLLAFCACAFALDPSLDVSQYAHTSWKIRDGFFKGRIFSMAQTPDGYLWLGTEFGLLRFDGVRTVPWPAPTGESLPGAFVLSLLAARDGRLWIGTLQGLASWKDGKLTHYPDLDEQGVVALLEDREGTVWAAAEGIPTGSLCALRSGGTQCYGKDGSLGVFVEALYEDPAGELWVGGAHGKLWRWRPGPPKPYVMPDKVVTAQALIAGDNGTLLIATPNGIRQLVDGKPTEYRVLSSGKFDPRSLFRDRDGGLWIGTSDRGLLHVHQGRTDVFAQPDGLSGDDVLTIFEDREGNIWVATVNGLDRFREFAMPTISVKQGLSNANPWSVMAAEDGSVWLGTRDGLNKWDNGQVTVYRRQGNHSLTLATGQGFPSHDGQSAETAVREISSSGLPDDKIYSLFQEDDRQIWVSTSRGVAIFENGHFTPISGIPEGQVHGFAADKAGNVWLSHQDDGLFHMRGGRVVERMPWPQLGIDVFAEALLFDPVQGGLWLGSPNSGLTYFSGGKVRASYSSADGLEGGITSLQMDKDGALWITSANGLSRVKNGRVATLSSKNGLPCNRIHSVIEDDSYALWVYATCGLLRISRAELDAWATEADTTPDQAATRKIQFTIFDSSDGVRTYELVSGYSPHVAKSKDGRLWFPALDGIGVVDPRRIPFNKLPPPVHIEQVTADRKTYDASSGLRLPPHVRDLEVDYTALSFVVPEKVRFRYKLEGRDRDWQDVGNRRRAFYTDLPPGNYRFRVIACNNSGVWNEQGASLEFAIAPAYYQTMWFRALCVAALLALLWVAYYLRVRQLRQQEKKLRNVIETIPTFAWTAQPDGSVDFANRNWQEYAGLSTEKTVGSGWETAVHPADLKRHKDRARASVATGEPLESEVRFRNADGEYRWFLVRAVPLRDAQGKIVKWYGISTDIEDRKRAEQERERLQSDLAHVNRVSTMGELTASLAHEIKQPIAATITNANTSMRWLKREQPDLGEACEAIQRILEDGRRASDIIDRLKSLYKKSAPKRELVEVGEVVREMVVLLRGEANRYAVSIRIDLADDLPKITADRVQLQQVLMNLMLNAIEAMKETGGVLTVKSQLDQDGGVLISVSDTGVGLPAEKADQIFNAFFTTKPQGSGMGLAISRSIIESHGGRLWAVTNDGRGATFHFTVPTAIEELGVPVTGM